ncbi:MAG: L-threonylcarbamoyladenylate synthase [Bifidobacteriaceae bacterium]|jgi:tRNA threonylcarbamoyl adenosine modification protein (Sua5/YciO/YrdC/YwlC family)|nr:L-threonylcarbamoyladenylate synthase [Bifidobacteriaceae bacterium]
MNDVIENNSIIDNDDIIRILREGYVLQLPTDTLPGLICDPHNKNAIDKIFTKKNRSYDKRLPILIPEDWNEETLVKKWSPLEKALIEKYWPGALTIVKRYTSINHLYLGDYSDTIAIRCPNDPILLNVLERFGPVACTSANKSGEKPKNENSKGSTIIEVVNEKIRVLRDGDIIIK